MAFKPPIHGNSTYEVSFKSSSQSQGVSLMTVGWVPKHGNPVPDVEDTAIAPGAEMSVSGRVPAHANARRMEIRVDLPDGKALGTLTLKENGKVHSSNQISVDTTWTCLVLE
jgi:hypothetical protein